MHIVVDDAKLDVFTAGEGDAVVLLHGFPFAHEIWQTQIQKLRDHCFVIAPDLRGLGKSSAVPGPYLMEQLASDVAAIMDALGVKRAAIAGHSAGGYVALAFFRMFAERVSRLALVSSRLDADTPERAAQRQQLADAAEREGMQPVVDAYREKLFAPQTNGDVIAYALDLAMQTDPRGAAAMLRGMALRSASDDLVEDMQLPVLIVTGAHDSMAPPDYWRDAARAFPSARLEVMARSAHVPMLEKPTDLAGLFQKFFIPAADIQMGDPA